MIWSSPSPCYLHAFFLLALGTWTCPVCSLTCLFSLSPLLSLTLSPSHTLLLEWGTAYEPCFPLPALPSLPWSGCGFACCPEQRHRSWRTSLEMDGRPSSFPEGFYTFSPLPLGGTTVSLPSSSWTCFCICLEPCLAYHPSFSGGHTHAHYHLSLITPLHSLLLPHDGVEQTYTGLGRVGRFPREGLPIPRNFSQPPSPTTHLPTYPFPSLPSIFTFSLPCILCPTHCMGGGTDRWTGYLRILEIDILHTHSSLPFAPFITTTFPQGHYLLLSLLYLFPPSPHTPSFFCLPPFPPPEGGRRRRERRRLGQTLACEANDRQNIPLFSVSPSISSGRRQGRHWGHSAKSGNFLYLTLPLYLSGERGKLIHPYSNFYLFGNIIPMSHLWLFTTYTLSSSFSMLILSLFLFYTPSLSLLFFFTCLLPFLLYLPLALLSSSSSHMYISLDRDHHHFYTHTFLLFVHFGRHTFLPLSGSPPPSCLPLPPPFSLYHFGTTLCRAGQCFTTRHDRQTDRTGSWKIQSVSLSPLFSGFLPLTLSPLSLWFGRTFQTFPIREGGNVCLFSPHSHFSIFLPLFSGFWRGGVGEWSLEEEWSGGRWR